MARIGQHGSTATLLTIVKPPAESVSMNNSLTGMKRNRFSEAGSMTTVTPTGYGNDIFLLVSSDGVKKINGESAALI
jgi:hypothetical protein